MWVTAVRGHLDQMTNQMAVQNSHMLTIIQNQDRQLAAMEMALDSCCIARVPATSSTLHRIMLEMADTDMLLLDARTHATLLTQAADCLEQSSDAEIERSQSLQSGLSALAALHSACSACMRGVERVQASLTDLEESPQTEDLAEQLQEQQAAQALHICCRLLPSLSPASVTE
jgi:hypothetical protein